ncbi:hypothetical protein NXC24_PC01580 (plasmid) [Rhizobium sp. NXC24]|nr:hypothetical protein NXC24_PC01580 [Rhizobium sp. NXC24]
MSFHLRSPSVTGELSHRSGRPAPRSLLSNSSISLYVSSVIMRGRKARVGRIRLRSKNRSFDAGGSAYPFAQVVDRDR